MALHEPLKPPKLQLTKGQNYHDCYVLSKYDGINNFLVMWYNTKTVVSLIPSIDAGWLSGKIMVDFKIFKIF